MIRYACRYPDGAAGLALLALRLCCACAALVAAAMLAGTVGAGAAYPAAALLALLLLIGLATRLAALLLAVAVAAALSMAGTVQQLLFAGLLGGCAALAIVGAGAFSVDARRHGRRVIRLRTRPPDRVGED